jgi:hypothetical protein
VILQKPRQPLARKLRLTWCSLLLPHFRHQAHVSFYIFFVNSSCNIFIAHPQLLWPPVLGQQGVNWADIFNLIKQPKELWARWKPSGTLDTYKTVRAVWDLFNEGESIYSGEVKTGKNPPLRLVEKHFGSQWRSGSDVSLYCFVTLLPFI